MSVSTLVVADLPPDRREAVLDELAARVLRNKILVRQRPDQLGTYDVCDGKAFHACPVVLVPEEMARREAAHQRALAGQGPWKTSSNAVPKRELKNPLAEPGDWTFEASSRRIVVSHRTWVGARSLAAVHLGVRSDELKLLASPLDLLEATR